MHLKSPKLLEDIRVAANYILRATTDQTLESYLDNETLRFAVERNFEIIGEALNRLATVDPDTASQIEDFRQIIAFRNILIHGYDTINHSRVWLVAQDDLPSLLQQVVQQLQSGN